MHWGGGVCGGEMKVVQEGDETLCVLALDDSVLNRIHLLGMVGDPQILVCAF